MDDIREMLRDVLPAIPTHASELRGQFVGCSSSVEKLNEAGFCRSRKYTEYNCWRKPVGRRDKLHLYFDNQMQLVDVRLYDPPYVHLDAGPRIRPVPHIEEFDSARGRKSALSLLQRVSDGRSPEIAEEEWGEMLRLCPDYGVSPSQPESEVVGALLSHAESLRMSGEPHLAARHVIGLARHSKQLSDPDSVCALAMIASGLGLFGESTGAIRRLLELENIEAEQWTNAGCIFCDEYLKPREALHCFLEAIRCDPELDAPRQNLWFAGCRLLHDGFLRNDYAVVHQVEEDIRTYASSKCPAELHGYWSFAGLCYEGEGDEQRARKCYEAALKLQPDCVSSKMAMRRLQIRDPEERRRGFASQQRWVWRSEQEWC